MSAQPALEEVQEPLLFRPPPLQVVTPFLSLRLDGEAWRAPPKYWPEVITDIHRVQVWGVWAFVSATSLRDLPPQLFNQAKRKGTLPLVLDAQGRLWLPLCCLSDYSGIPARSHIEPVGPNASYEVLAFSSPSPR